MGEFKYFEGDYKDAIEYLNKADDILETNYQVIKTTNIQFEVEKSQLDIAIIKSLTYLNLGQTDLAG